MDDRLMLDDDRFETRRSMLKLLEYVEKECARVGFSASTWMVSMSRDMLENELLNPCSLHFDASGHPRPN